MPTTIGESAIIALLERRPELYADRRLLHVGFGNSALPTALEPRLAAYVGITVSLPEIEQFKAWFGENGRCVAHLANKHDPRVYAEIEGPFDLIVDVNLKSYACCDKHFDALMDFYLGSLSDAGMVVTAERGLRFGWAGNVAVSHTPGADPDPSVGERRVLGVEGLETLCRRQGLALTAVPVAEQDKRPAETVWIASRREILLDL